MSAIAGAGGLNWSLVAEKALNASARLWFGVAVIGQAIFALYVLVAYSSAAARGDFKALRFITGDTTGNIAFATHVLMAVILTIGGPLQLIPQIRARAPTFHRWNGRVYLVAAFTAAIMGLYMILSRGTVGSVFAQVGICLGAILILVFGVTALHYALARDFQTHRRWAMRLWLTASGVWFFRIGMMFWILVNRGPAGFNPKTLEGPFMDFLSYASYLLPLAILELYFAARDRGGVAARLTMAAGLVVVSVATAVGIFGATMAIWMRKLGGANGMWTASIVVALVAISAIVVAPRVMRSARNARSRLAGS